MLSLSVIASEPQGERGNPKGKNNAKFMDCHDLRLLVFIACISHLLLIIQSFTRQKPKFRIEFNTKNLMQNSAQNSAQNLA